MLEERFFYFDYATQIRMAAIAKRLGVEDTADAILPLMQRVLGEVLNDVYLPMVVIANNILLTVKNERRRIEVRDIPQEADLRAEIFYDPQC